MFLVSHPEGQHLRVWKFCSSSLIGAVGLALGGGVGAFIGGMRWYWWRYTWGIAYDYSLERMEFSQNHQQQRGVKAATQFKDGGYVGEPVKNLVNSVDKSII